MVSLLPGKLVGVMFKALRGMAGVLQSARPVVICEIHWLLLEMDKFRRDYLEPMNYSVKMLIRVPFPTPLVRYHVVLEPQ